MLTRILDSYRRRAREGLVKNPYPSLKGNKTITRIIKGELPFDVAVKESVVELEEKEKANSGVHQLSAIKEIYSD